MEVIKILLVDDEEINRKIIMYSLNKEIYEFIESENGISAIEKLKETDIDIILLDLMMPEMDGFEFLSWKQKQEDYKNIPVIVNSALMDMDNIVRAMELGVYEYFTKPLQSDVLKYQLPLKIRNAVNFYQLYQSLLLQKQEMERQKLRLEEELKIASELQKSLLPKQKISEKNFEIFSICRPIDDLGGDFFDYTIGENDLQLIIADVSGHGTSAALLTSALKSFYQNHIKQKLPPHILLKILNENLYNILNHTDYYITALSLLIHFQDKTISGSNAGHLLPILYKSKTGKLDSLESPSFFLGIMPNQNYDLFTMNYDPGDIMFIFTDGLVELKNQNNEEYSIERLKKMILSYNNDNLEIFIEKIEEDLKKFSQGRDFNDDYSIIALRLN